MSRISEYAITPNVAVRRLPGAQRPRRESATSTHAIRILLAFYPLISPHITLPPRTCARCRQSAVASYRALALRLTMAIAFTPAIKIRVVGCGGR